MKKNLSIKYRFRLASGSEERIDLELDSHTLELLGNTPAKKPAWTKLEFHQCPNCPLSPKSHPHCPLALNLVSVVERFDGVVSHDTVEMEVVTGERTITQTTSAQRGIGALMGLIIATSGCPHTVYLRPMARFHLPFASNEETFYRATSMYMLSQYFVKKAGGKADLGLEGLVKIYREMEIINEAIVDRLRAATTTDSSVNALVVLDIYAKTLGLITDESLQRIRYLFTPYFKHNPGDT